jgi:TfoX/Sxy family transcriptional regulator of competence genes
MRADARSPKSNPAAREAFRSYVPDDERVSLRPMFGTVAAFANGQMFMGLFNDELFVRLPEDERRAALAAGCRPLEPMPGRPMREYVSVPDWKSAPQRVPELAQRSLAYALTLPPKAKKTSRPR